MLIIFFIEICFFDTQNTFISLWRVSKMQLSCPFHGRQNEGQPNDLCPPHLMHRKHFVLHWGFGQKQKQTDLVSNIWKMDVVCSKRSPSKSGFEVQILNILWNNPIWPFHATSSCRVRGSVTFYCLNKKPLWSFPPTPQHRTAQTQNGTHEILVISIWFCQNFPLETSKFSLIVCVLFCFFATILV